MNLLYRLSTCRYSFVAKGRIEMLKYLSLPNPTEAELSALRSYKSAEDTPEGQSHCFDLNQNLRNGLRLDDLSNELRETALSIDAVLARCPRLKEPVTVFRGIGERRCHPVHLTGSRFRNLQYWSSTVLEANTESYMTPSSPRSGYGAILELQLPKGFPAYNMETLGGFGGHEAELLLPRNVLWKVGSSNKTQSSRYLEPHFVNILRVELTAEQWD